MTITFHGDDLKLKGASLDHIFSAHGLEGCDAAMESGWQRKSKWYGNENEVTSQIHAAFDSFRQWAKGEGEVTLAQNANKRSAVDIDMGVQCGTGVNGAVTHRVRLVMEITHSGDAFLVTAFPW